MEDKRFYAFTYTQNGGVHSESPRVPTRQWVEPTVRSAVLAGPYDDLPGAQGPGDFGGPLAIGSTVEW